MHQIEERERIERAVLVGVELPGDDSHSVAESMGELERLAYTAGAQVAGRVIQKKSRPDGSTFLGKGKALEVADLCILRR